MKIVLFLGAGFSVQSGFPSTGTINEQLLTTPKGGGTSVEEFIAIRSVSSGKLFGWKRGMNEPSLADSSSRRSTWRRAVIPESRTLHSIKLRAIRQMTIHRIWSQISRPQVPFPHDCVVDVLKNLSWAFEVTIITTNWDAHIEWILTSQGINFNYGVEEVGPDGAPVDREGNTSVLKLHGCVNTAYCDCCQKVTRLAYGLEQPVVKLNLLLDPDDFRLLGAVPGIVDLLQKYRLIPDLQRRHHEVLRACGVCHVWGRVSRAFTYRKELQVYHEVWDAARTSLQQAAKWLFIGYSMPEADVELAIFSSQRNSPAVTLRRC